MSIFNAEALKQVVIEGAMDTEAIPFPIMEAVVAVVKSFTIEAIKDKVKLTVIWNCNAPEVAEVTGREDNNIRQNVWLDLTASGNLDLGRGKNVGLGKLRTALGQNDPSEPWGFGHIVGQVAKLRTSQRLGDDGTIYAEVKNVFSADYDPTDSDA